MRAPVLMVLLGALASCASVHVGFDAMTPEQVHRQRVACWNSPIMRAVEGCHRPELHEALSDETHCHTHAAKAIAYLAERGIVAWHSPPVWLPYDGDRPPSKPPAAITIVRDRHGFMWALHGFAITEERGELLAIDNGGIPLCNRICTLEEAMRFAKLERPE